MADGRLRLCLRRRLMVSIGLALFSRVEAVVVVRIIVEVSVCILVVERVGCVIQKRSLSRLEVR